jgi:amino acid transporter
MNRQRLYHFLTALALVLSVVAGSFTAQFAVQNASAQTANQQRSPVGQLQEAGVGYNNGTQSPPKDIRLVVAGIIRFALGLVGTIMLLLMLYAGFLWFSAQGNDEQVQKAKKTVLNAVIGMVLIAMTYTILVFVFRTIFVPGQVSTGTTPLQDAVGTRSFWNNQLNPISGGFY